jgi:cobalt/nickel transport system permease protein
LSLKSALYIGIAIFAIFLISFRDFFKISKRVIKSVFLFNLGVSVSYLIMAYFKNIQPWNYLIYINLKVFLMTYFVFWFFTKVDIVEFFSFNKELSYLLTITISQVISYKKTFMDFRDAFRARVISLRDKEKQFIVNTFNFFLKKAMHDSKERSLAMKARGFFDE